MAKCMGGLIHSMKKDVMARCAERIAHKEQEPRSPLVFDCQHGVSMKLKNKYF